MPPTVNARIPLSLLEAVRRKDTPETDTEEEEYVQELRNKRLGLSDTVYQQIKRYSDAAKKGQGIPYAEVTGLGTLIGRRPDAEELFENAGRILANDVYATISGALRKTISHGAVGCRATARAQQGTSVRCPPFRRHAHSKRKFARPERH